MPSSLSPWVSRRIARQIPDPPPSRDPLRVPARRKRPPLFVGISLLLSGLAIGPSFAGEQLTLPPKTLAFEPNQGQADRSVEFLARGKGYLLYLRPTEAVLALKSPSPTAAGTPKPLRMRLLGATAKAKTAGQAHLPGRHNYYVGNDPARWHTNIPTFAKVVATGVYPGVDLVYYGKEGMLEYDFMVAAGADPRAIRLGFDGADKLRVNHKGELLITAGKAQLVQHPPYAYQNIADKRVPVAARYALRGRTVSLDLGDYDHHRPLIIDPALSYSSYLGGSSDDKAQAVAVDADGNIYVTGSTLSPDFPEAKSTALSSGENSDAFVTKISKSGTVIFSTYLGSGGTTDSGYNLLEGGNGIAVSNGKIYVTGGTASNVINGKTFPTNGTLASYQTCGITTNYVFVSILNNDGTLYYSTCVGSNAAQAGMGIAVDDTGNAYVAGWTTSSNFPTSPGALQTTKNTAPDLRDSFFFKLNPAGGTSGLVYSTYLGSTLDTSIPNPTLCCSTYATAVAVDSQRMAYVAGWTTNVASNGVLPTAFENALTAAGSTYSGGKDAFWYKIDPTSASPILYATYLGGSGDDTATGIAIASPATGDPDIYVTGQTLSSGFPTTTNAFQRIFKGGSTLGDSFVAKFSSTANSQYALSYSTYLGGSGEDGATGIAVDNTTGRAYATGSTTSTDFPIQSATNMQTAFNKNFNTSAKDAFVTSMEASGSSLHYSTYLGGELDDQAQGIAVAATDKAYVVGYTPSFTFPVTADAAQKDNKSNQQSGGLGFDAFVARIAPVANLSVIIAAHSTTDLTTTAPPVGDPLTYSIVVANLGPDPATGITLTVDLSAPDDLGSTTPLNSPVYDSAACQYDGNGKELFTCSLTDLAVSEQKTITISGTLSTGSDLVATTTVKSNELDAVSTTYTLTAGQSLPPPSTIVTGGGSTPTPTGGGSGGGGGGALGPLVLLLLTLATLAKVSRLGPRRRQLSRGLL